MEFWGFGWAIFLVWLMWLFTYVFKAPDAIYGLYFSIGYFIIESLILIVRLIRKH